ncbi:hypothetical protein OQA88_11623 [Cercophora sp. LCS_1]
MRFLPLFFLAGLGLADKWEDEHRAGFKPKHKGPQELIHHPEVPQSWHRELRSIEEKFYGSKYNNDLIPGPGEYQILKFALEPIEYTSDRCSLTIESNLGFSDKNVEIECPSTAITPRIRSGSQQDILYSIRQDYYKKEGYDVCVTFEPIGELCTFVRMRGTRGINMPAGLSYSQEMIDHEKIKDKFGGGQYSTHEHVWNHADRAKFDQPHWSITFDENAPGVKIAEDYIPKRFVDEASPGLTAGPQEPVNWNNVFMATRADYWRDRKKLAAEEKEKAAKEKETQDPQEAKLESAREQLKKALVDASKSKADFGEAVKDVKKAAKETKELINKGKKAVKDTIEKGKRRFTRWAIEHSDRMYKIYEEKRRKEFWEKVHVDEKARLDYMKKHGGVGKSRRGDWDPQDVYSNGNYGKTTRREKWKERLEKVDLNNIWGYKKDKEDPNKPKGHIYGYTKTGKPIYGYIKHDTKEIILDGIQDIGRHGVYAYTKDGKKIFGWSASGEPDTTGASRIFVPDPRFPGFSWTGEEEYWLQP